MKSKKVFPKKRPKRPSSLKMSDFIRPRAVRETSGTVRRAGKSRRTAWIGSCDPMPEGKLPLKKRPLELDSKSALRMWDECFLFTLEKTAEKEEKNRKGDQTETKSSGFYK